MVWPPDGSLSTLVSAYVENLCKVLLEKLTKDQLEGQNQSKKGEDSVNYSRKQRIKVKFIKLNL